MQNCVKIVPKNIMPVDIIFFCMKTLILLDHLTTNRHPPIEEKNMFGDMFEVPSVVFKVNDLQTK